MSKQKRSDRFYELVDDLLTYISLAKIGNSKKVLDRIPASYFDRAEPWTQEFVLSQLPPEEAALGIPSAADVGPIDDIYAKHPPERLASALDYSFIGHVVRYCDEMDKYKFALCRVRQITRKEARGRLAAQCEYNFRIAQSFVTKDGEIDASSFHFEGFTGKRWYGDAGGDIRNPSNLWLHEQMISKVKLVSVMQGIAESHWKVRLGYTGLPRITFNTDPDGVREVFRLRDVPEGRTRRAALRHWVSEHWRTFGDERPIEVRKHLRGKVDFTWNGLRCEIEPSLADRRENQEDVQVITPDNLERVLGEAA